LQNKELTNTVTTDFAISLAILLQKHPELKQIIESWSAIPEHIKQTINTLIKAQDK
jgi:hypothetical protein